MPSLQLEVTVQHNPATRTYRCIPLFLTWMLLLALTVHPTMATAQDYNPGYTLATKKTVSLYSSVLKEKRSIEIIVPPNFKKGSSTRYHAIYILDGIRAYHYVATDYLKGEGFLPRNTILVGLLGIKDTNTRYRDFTPTRTAPDSGGADKFLLFLKTELASYINKVYHSDSEHSTLVGGSLGGLFVMYTLFTEPALFKAYIALDPSLWWDHGYLNTLASEKLRDMTGLHRVLWINGRDGDAYREMGIAPMEAILQAKAPADLTWKCTAYPNETHLTTGFKGFWDAVKFTYGGYYPDGIGFKPRDGIVLKDKPFTLWCYQLLASRYIHYTTNGAEPMLKSPCIAPVNSFRISENTTLTIKSFSAREYDNTVAKGNFKVGVTLPAMAKPEGVQAGGLRYAYFEGRWEMLPDFTQLKPNRAGIADQGFDLNSLPREKTFACLLQGYLEIRTEGYYILELGDEGGSKVYLGEHQVIGDHYDSQGGATYIVPLEKGFYPFRVEYFHKKGGRNLAPVYMKPEGKEEFPIPLELLYSNHAPEPQP